MTVLDKGQGYSGQLPGTSLALGYFDGVHLGHQAVVGAAVEYGKHNGLTPAVFTFSQPEGGRIKGKKLLSDASKHRALAALGVEVCFEPAFTSFCALAPEEFFRWILAGRYQAQALFCGEDFAFGANRAGNVELLRQLCAENNIHFETVPTACRHGQPVSSSRIRQELAAGNIAEANAMLGRPWEVELPVRRGQGLGHQFGFPTINQVFPNDMQPPAPGVYITRTVLPRGQYPSATGYGSRPTVGAMEKTCETFLPGFEGDLYGKTVRVQFHAHIDYIRKFDSMTELAQAVQLWAKAAVAYFDRPEKDGQP